MKITRRRLIGIVKIMVIVYCLIGIALYYLQDRFLFHPVKLSATHQFNFAQPYGEINIPIDNTDTINIVKFLSEKKPAKGAVIYYHGNEKNVERYAPFTHVFLKNGYDVWMMDYPGFGKSTGEITEQKLYAYAMQVRKRIATAYSGDSIIIYGKSLGTGLATYVAASQKARMLILETPYYNIVDLLGYYAPIYPAGTMSKYRFPTDKYIQDVKCPIYIFAGTDDWIVPHTSAEKLKPLLKSGDEFISIEGASHNNIYPLKIYQDKMNKLLE